MRNSWLAPAGLAAAALVVAACGSSTSSGGSGGSGGSAPAAAPSSSSPAAAAAGGTLLKTAKVGGATLLTNAKGFTLYWFAPDTSVSKCYGSCAVYWPPVPGPATAGNGVTGKLGVTIRKDGTKQATWNGHPLYTYAGDTAPGEAKGNKVNASGGLWYDIAMPGKSTTASGSGGGGSGGSGY